MMRSDLPACRVPCQSPVMSPLVCASDGATCAVAWAWASIAGRVASRHAESNARFPTERRDLRIMSTVCLSGSEGRLRLDSEYAGLAARVPEDYIIIPSQA